MHTTRSPDLQKFITYHKDNPQVFAHFEQFTRAAAALGHQNLSAWLIMNRVRWETTIATEAADGFKIPPQSSTTDDLALHGALRTSSISVGPTEKQVRCR